MKKLILAGVASLLMAGLAGAASASTVVGAKSVHITSTNNTWIQVSELQAFDFASLNVALDSNGGVATAPNVYPGGNATPGQANDGDLPYAQPYDNLYHSGGTGPGNFLDITFANLATLASLTIYGRTDCCSERDIFTIDVLNATGGVLYSGTFNASGETHSATVSFDRPVGNPVPEPAAWALMLSGFGLAGAALRRRRAMAMAA
jgi:hypothetical protein